MLSNAFVLNGNKPYCCILVLILVLGKQDKSHQQSSLFDEYIQY